MRVPNTVSTDEAVVFDPNQRIEKVIVITGASRGIGAASAEFLAARGAKLVLAARSQSAIETLANAISQAGGTAFAVKCDVSNFQDVEHLVAQTLKQFGRLDVLVNNAGLIDPIARISGSDPASWAHIVDVNYKGVYFGMRAALPAMLDQGAGTIINISSGAATSALEGWSHYCSTKAAVLSLTRCADKEYRAQGIQVVGLSPGTVATDMQVKIKASGINPVSQLDPSVHIKPEWVAQSVAMLCTPIVRQFAGSDFSLKTDEGRTIAGLPPL